MQIRLFIFVVGVLLGGTTLELVRRKVLRPEYALLWAAMSVITFLVALFPGVVALVGRLTGMDYQSTVIMMLFIFATLMFMNYSVIVSGQSSRIIRLTQEISLLKMQLEELERKEGDGKS